MHDNFLKEYVEQILDEAELKLDADTRNRLRDSLLQKIHSQLLLTVIASLDSEQAVQLTEKIESPEVDPAQVLTELAKHVPNMDILVAKALTDIRNDLFEDLRAAGISK